MKIKIITFLLFLFFSVTSYGQVSSISIEQVFNETKRIDGFQSVDYKSDGLSFPSEFGEPEMIIHGNAEPRDAVIALLSRLPEESLVYDYTDDRGKFDRFFLDRITNSLLYVSMGLGGGDSVLILFWNGNKDNIEQFIEVLKSQE